MAKKNLASLMSGIMGDQNLPQPAGDGNPQPAATADNGSATVYKEADEPQREAKPRSKVGRPRKGEVREKPDETRATFIVNPELVRKMKYISLVEGNLLKDVIGEALQNYIDSWEEANGKIKLPKKK